MRVKATLYLEDELPYIELEDGTIIDHSKIGFVSQGYSGWASEYHTLEPITSTEVLFIINNNIDIEIEMVDEFTNPELYDGIAWGDGEATPKLHKNKVIIHYR